MAKLTKKNSQKDDLENKISKEFAKFKNEILKKISDIEKSQTTYLKRIEAIEEKYGLKPKRNYKRKKPYESSNKRNPSYLTHKAEQNRNYNKIPMHLRYEFIPNSNSNIPLHLQYEFIP